MTAAEQRVAELDKSFSQVFEDVIHSFLSEKKIPDRLEDLCKSKREFGLKKYQEKSYQNSFENLMQCPLQLHAEEEIIDSVNYVVAALLVSNMLGNKENTAKYDRVLSMQIAAWKELVK